MAQPSRLRIIVLLIAVAQLATEVTRLVSAWTPSQSRRDRIEERMKPSWSGPYGSEPGKDLGTRRMAPSDRSARGPPSDSRGYRPAPSQRVWRCERRYGEWYCEWYYEW
jgi:hypothetical protein